MLIKILLVIFSSLALISCDDLTGADTGANDIPAGANALGGVVYKKISGNKLLFEGTMDNGGDSSHNFELELKLQDDKKGIFYFFANDELNQGMKLIVEKIGGNAKITLQINGFSHFVEKSLPADGVLRLSFDAHNDHEDAHILIWNLAGPFDDSEECAFDGTCIYNTESFTDPNPGPWGTHGKGSGSFWGFEGDKEIILKIKGPVRPISDA